MVLGSNVIKWQKKMFVITPMRLNMQTYNKTMMLSSSLHIYLTEQSLISPKDATKLVISNKKFPHQDFTA